MYSKKNNNNTIDNNNQFENSLIFNYKNTKKYVSNSENDFLYESIGIDLPKVIKEKWTNNLYQDVKPMLSDKTIAFNVPEFKSKSYLKGFGSETMNKWINDKPNKGSTKLFASRSFVAENQSRSQNSIFNPLQHSKHDFIQQNVNKTKFSYNLERRNSKLDFFDANTNNTNNNNKSNFLFLENKRFNQNNIQRKLNLIRNPLLAYDQSNSTSQKPKRDRLTFDGKIHNTSKLNRTNTFYDKKPTNQPIMTQTSKINNNNNNNNNSNKQKQEDEDIYDLLASSSEEDLFDKIDINENTRKDVSRKESSRRSHQNREDLNDSLPTSNTTPKKNQPEIAKAKLKCKTPIHYAPDKRISDLKTPAPTLSRVISAVQTPKISKTPKLIKRVCPDDAKKKELEKLFAKLDLDEDGHLSFELIENIFCKNLNNAQYSFFKQIYNILSDSTFFGVQEFRTFILLLEVIFKQKYRNLNSINFNVDEEDSLENYWDHFMATDFEDYQKEIVEYIKQMDTIDMTKKINILDIMRNRFKTLDADKLIKALTQHFDSQYLYLQLNYTIKGGDNVSNKILQYVALIPLFIYIESIIKNKVIFKRRQNTILNFKDATNLHTFNRRLFD